MTVEIKNTSYSLPSGERVLRHEAVTPAPVAEVWQALTTTDGVRAGWVLARDTQ